MTAPLQGSGRWNLNLLDHLERRMFRLALRMSLPACRLRPMDMLEKPIPRDPMQQRRKWVDDGRRCVHCRWVEIKMRGDGQLSIGCTDPRCCYGQAKWDGSCCGWEREPGADDEMG